MTATRPSTLARVRRRLEGPERVALRQRLVAKGASAHPRRPDDRWRPWANTALATRADAERAVEEVRACGLLPHRDVPKNWDLLVALGTILERGSRWSPVLEMGAARYSPLLTWLFQYGFRNLRGIDLVYDQPVSRGPIRLDPMDLTATTFPDRSFQAIACLSVIEHGVDTEAYVREAARLLRPGGILVTSTDYWCDPVDTGTREAYGHPVRVLDRAAVESLLDAALAYGLHPVGPPDLACRDRVVHWGRFDLDYTFLALVHEARPGHLGHRIRAGLHRLAR